MEKDAIERLVAIALECNGRSYAPYSRYNVSAAVLADDGRIFTGVNVENASYPCGICAERNAIFHAVAEGCRHFSAIAIVGGRDYHPCDDCTPCGLCRQVMREFCDPEKFIVACAKSATEYRTFTLAGLLPESFGPDSFA